MKVFLRALLIIVFLAVFIGLIVLMFTSNTILEWMCDALVGIPAGIMVAYVLYIPLSIIDFVSDNPDTRKAAVWVLTIIGVAVAIFVTIWLNVNANLLPF